MAATLRFTLQATPRQGWLYIYLQVSFKYLGFSFQLYASPHRLLRSRACVFLVVPLCSLRLCFEVYIHMHEHHSCAEPPPLATIYIMIGASLHGRRMDAQNEPEIHRVDP